MWHAPRGMLLIAAAALASPCFGVPPPAPVVRGTVALSAGRVFLLSADEGAVAVFAEPATMLEGVVDVARVEPGDRVRVEVARRTPGAVIAGRVTVLPKPVPATPALLAPAELAVSPGQRTIVDCREREGWERGHVPGAVSAERAGPLLAAPCGDGGLVLVDADGYGEAAFPVFQRLARSGCVVSVLRGGTTGYARGGLPLAIEPGGVRGAAREKPLLAIDARGADAFRKGHIPGAFNVPLETMSWEGFSSPVGMPELLFYGEDAGDARAEEAARKALRWRFQQASQADGPVAFLAGGFAAWVAEGRAVETGDPAWPFTSAAARHPDEADPDEVARLLTEHPPAATLVDLRERRLPRPAGTLHVPLEELPERIGELPKGREVVVFCSQGIRSRIAVGILRANGFRARFTREPGTP